METLIHLWEQSLSTSTLDAENILTTVLLQCDTPSQRTNRIYPRSEVEKAVKSFMSKPSPRLGYTDRSDSDPHMMDFNKVSHEVVSMDVDESGAVVGRIKVLDTPQGQILKKLLNPTSGVWSVRFTPIMSGTVNGENGVVSNLKFHATTVIPFIGE